MHSLKVKSGRSSQARLSFLLENGFPGGPRDRQTGSVAVAALLFFVV
jgi:hypothetical protein